MSKVDRIVIHIGKRKTGSSSIQRSLHGVDQNGFRYAALTRQNHSTMLAALVPRYMAAERKRYDSPTDAQMLTRRDERVTAIEAAIGTEPARTVLFSAETLERASEDEARGIVEFMSRFTDRVEVFGFARPPIAAQSSEFQERVKHGFARAEMPTPIYRRTFEPYMKAVGSDRVTILPFIPSTFIDGSLLKTFLHGIGESEIDVKEFRVNESMAADATRMLHIFNNLRGIEPTGAYYTRGRDALWRLLARSVAGDKLDFADALHPLRELRADIDWLKETAGIDFSADLDRMNPDAAEASALLKAELMQVSDAGVAQLLDLVEEKTGKRPLEMRMALHRLYHCLAQSTEAVPRRTQAA